MNDSTNSDSIGVARRATATLAREWGDTALPALLERVLTDGNATPGQQQYGDPPSLAIATFILTVAKFAFDVYKDHRDKRDKRPDRESEAIGRAEQANALARQLRVSIELPSGITPMHRDRVVAVVVAEVLSHHAATGS